MLEELERKTGEREFHFTELLNGKRGYRRLSLADRFEYFGAFADLAERLKVTFMVQSLGVKEGAEWLNALQIDYPPLRKAFRLERPSELALFLLVLRVQDFLKAQMPPHLRAVVFVDEGWKKNRMGAWLGPLEEQFLHGFMMSARSSEVPGLQLADFGAFMLNRSQFAFGKQPLSKPNEWIASIWSRLGRRFLNMAERALTVQKDEAGVYLIEKAEASDR
jgi:hypothetical protein